MRKTTVQPVIAVFTTIVGRKNYIHRFSTRPDRKILPDYTVDPDKAHDFGTWSNALEHIDRINNCHDRKFEPEELHVTSDNKPATFGKSFQNSLKQDCKIN
jgi:hypothetical protein